MEKLRVIFMGTPDFAVPCLEKLSEAADVMAVITQPDRPRGRGQKLVPSPVKAFAAAHGMQVLQPEKVKTPEFEAMLQAMAPDLIVVVAFGQILSQKILDIPHYGCINVHASLLPRYRGAAPIHWSIINGETKTGVTTMFMDAGLDTGDMLLKSETAITPEMTTEELHDALMHSGAELLVQTIGKLQAGTLVRVKQEDALSNYAPLLKKETGHIDWTASPEEVHNRVRGLNSWPGAYAILNGETFKIWRTRVAASGEKGKPGEILALTKHGFLVAAGGGAVEVLELQAPSKKKMTAGDYVRGHGLPLHACFE